MPAISLPKAITWLKALNKEFKEQKRGPDGRLTAQEWEDIKRWIRSHELPCRLVHSCYGFRLSVYEPCVTKDVKPDVVLIIDDRQFPFPSATQGFAGQGATLRRLCSLTHRRRNHELIAWCGFEPLKSSSQYVY